MTLGLSGSVAIVTGGSQGIGRSVVHKLLAEGANVITCARDEVRLQATIDEFGKEDAVGEVVPIGADVTQPGDLRRLTDLALERFGQVDILVNNAGTAARSDFLSLGDNEWFDDLHLKLFAAIRLSRLILPTMMANQSGRIINVTAVAGKEPYAGSMPTSVTRAAGIALTKALSKEFAPHGILVNTVCIGLVRSGQFDARWASQRGETTRDQYYADLAQRRSIPLGRCGYPEEVANTIAFLASPLSSFITGCAINVDGGMSHHV